MPDWAPMSMKILQNRKGFSYQKTDCLKIIVQDNNSSSEVQNT